MSHIDTNLDKINLQIHEALKNSKRGQQDVQIIAVTKTQSIHDMKTVLEYGINNVGENRVQEIIQKYPYFESNFIWHMIGHLQTNKIKSIIDKVELIHSVDSLKLAKSINKEAAKIGKIQNILLQVNISKEETKFGVLKEEVEGIIKEISLLPNIRLKGLMTIAPFVLNPEENRPIFRQLYEVFVDINCKNIDNITMDTLSMGMTNDFMVAIEEGSNMVRIGTAIFGQRE